MKPFGAIGAAIATLIAECLQLAIQLVYTKKYLKELFHLEVTIKSAISTTFSAIVILILLKTNVIGSFVFDTVEKKSFAELLMTGVVFVICYVALMSITRCSIMKDELNRFKKNFKKN